VTDLVPQAAIDAAMRARWQTGVRWLTQGTDDTPDTSLRNQLEAAAPHIIEAARPAIEAAFREKWAGPNRDKCQWWCEQYVQCQCGAVSNELEENTAFTELVQLGQEIGDN